MDLKKDDKHSNIVHVPLVLIALVLSLAMSALAWYLSQLYTNFGELNKQVQEIHRVQFSVKTKQEVLHSRMDAKDRECEAYRSTVAHSLEELNQELDRRTELLRNDAAEKSEDRFKGKDFEREKELLTTKSILLQEKNDQQHDFIWIAINKLQNSFFTLHKECRKALNE